VSESIVMPKLGLTMTEGTVVKWLKRAGDTVSAGEAVAEIETEKITNEVTAPKAGRIAKILVPEGATVEVGVPIALLAETEEEYDQLSR
jgi:pyruvate/2-oxoglutarate dehydrogenase complex dihydrolipoamide acyltransferase (E2) component